MRYKMKDIDQRLNDMKDKTRWKMIDKLRDRDGRQIER